MRKAIQSSRRRYWHAAPAGNHNWHGEYQSRDLVFASTGGDEGIDARSDDKGAEPEAITTGVVNGRTLVFLGLERAGGIMMFDVTNPRSPVFLQWQQTQDISPEDLVFVPAEQSPTGEAHLIASHEVSGSTVVFRIGD